MKGERLQEQGLLRLFFSRTAATTSTYLDPPSRPDPINWTWDSTDTLFGGAATVWLSFPCPATRLQDFGPSNYRPRQAGKFRWSGRARRDGVSWSRQYLGKRPVKRMDKHAICGRRRNVRPRLILRIDEKALGFMIITQPIAGPP